MPIAKIITKDFIKVWQPKTGAPMFIHTLRLSDGIAGDFFLMSLDEFNNGDNIEYEITPDLKFKIVRKKSAPANNYPPASNPPAASGYTAPPNQNDRPARYTPSQKKPEDFLGFVYGYAKDIHIARIQAAKGKEVPLQRLKEDVEEMYAHIHTLLGQDAPR